MVKKLQGKQSEQCMGCEVEIYATGHWLLCICHCILHDQYHNPYSDYLKRVSLVVQEDS